MHCLKTPKAREISVPQEERRGEDAKKSERERDQECRRSREGKRRKGDAGSWRAVYMNMYMYACVYIYLPTNSVSVYRTLCRDIQMQTNTPYIKLGIFSPSDSKLTVPLVFIT